MLTVGFHFAYRPPPIRYAIGSRVGTDEHWSSPLELGSNSQLFRGNRDKRDD